MNRAYYRMPGLSERLSNWFDRNQSAIYNEASDALDLYSRAYGSGMLGGMGIGGGGRPGTAGAGPWTTAGSRAGAAGYPGYMGNGQWTGVSPYNPYASQPWANVQYYYPTGQP